MPMDAQPITSCDARLASAKGGGSIKACSTQGSARRCTVVMRNDEVSQKHKTHHVS